jgi:predicted Rossmann-fold nucleotide-binding protein
MTEMLTWLQLRFHDKPVGILNVAGYFDLLLQFAQHMHAEGFLRNGGAPLYQVDTNAQSLLAQLRCRAAGSALN